MRALLVAFLLIALLPGCGLMREAKTTVWVALEPAMPQGGTRAGSPSLEVEAFATAASFRHDQLSIRLGPSQWSFTNYHRWVADPGEIIASAARDHLSRSDLFGAVFTPPGPLEADYRLSGAVRSLYWDRQNGAAVLEVEATLVALPDTLRGYWIYRKEKTVPDDDVQAYLRASAAALGGLLTDLARDIAGAIAGTPAPPPEDR